MTKLAALLGIAAVFALLPAQAARADVLNLTAGAFPDDELAALSSSGYPFAVGGGITGVSDSHFAFSAHLGPNGPSGYAVVTSAGLGGGGAQGHVVCFSTLAPNIALFGIVIEKASGFFTFPEFQYVTLLVADDAGPPVPGDGLSLFAESSPCRTSTAVGGGPVDQGNIVVKN